MSAPSLTAGGAVLARLAQLGVDLVFVNSGTDFPPIVEGLAEADAHLVDLPRAVLVAHEHVAVGMAHGYYFASGRPQAVMLHTNVGLSNGATGAINAATDHVPMLLMSGRTPTVEQDRFGARTVPIGWGQEMRDQTALVREACKWDYELRFPEQVPQLLDRAHAIACSTPKGPVYLSLPREVLCEPCPIEAIEQAPAMAPASIAASPAAIADAAELLAGAERPVIFAQRGAGDERGFEALARLADAWSIPVCQYWAVATAISAVWPIRTVERGLNRPTAFAAVSPPASSTASGSPESTVGASKRKCAMISDPNASSSVIGAVNDRPSPPPVANAASSKSSGRIPNTTLRPS